MTLTFGNVSCTIWHEAWNLAMNDNSEDKDVNVCLIFNYNLWKYKLPKVVVVLTDICIEFKQIVK